MLRVIYSPQQRSRPKAHSGRAAAPQPLTSPSSSDSVRDASLCLRCKHLRHGNMGSGASIDGETAKDVDDIDGKDREKLVECTKSMEELLDIVRQHLKRSKKSASGMRKEFARLSCIVDMINAELRVATLLHLRNRRKRRTTGTSSSWCLRATAGRCARYSTE